MEHAFGFDSGFDPGPFFAMDMETLINSGLNTKLCYGTGVEDAAQLISDVSVNDSPGSDPEFNIDEFCKSLILGEFGVDEPQSLPQAPNLPLNFEQDLEEGSQEEIEGDYSDKFLTDHALFQRCTRIIKLSYAKRLLLKRLKTIMSYPLPIPSEASGRRMKDRVKEGLPKEGDDENPYAKPRLPFLRTQNRVNFASEWEHSKVAKQFEPASFNARFRRRLRKSLKEEQGAQHVEIQNERTIIINSDLQQSSINEETCRQTETIGRVQGEENVASKPNCVDTARASHSVVVSSHDRELYKSKLPECRTLPGLDDFTFLLSPESQIHADIDPLLEFDGRVVQLEKEKRILDHILDVLKERNSARQDQTDEEDHCEALALVNSRQGSIPEPDVGTSAVGMMADRAFIMATKQFGKKEIGRPLQHVDRKLKSSAISSVSKLGKKQVSKPIDVDLFLHYMALREEAKKLGIPEQCLPTIPPGTSNPHSKQHKAYFTVERLTELIEHMSSLNVNVTDEPEPLSEDASEGDLRGNQESLRNNISSDCASKSIPNFFNCVENQDDEDLVEDIFAISSTIELGHFRAKKPKLNPAAEEEYPMNCFSEDEISDTESNMTEKIKKIFERRIIHEEDLVSEISSKTNCKRSLKRGKSKSKDTRHLFSDEDDDFANDDGLSVASERITRILGKRVFKKADLISEIGSISPERKQVTKRKRPKGKSKTDKLANLFSDEEFLTEDDALSVASDRVKRILSTTIVKNSELISEIGSPPRKTKTNRKTKLLLPDICDDKINCEVTSKEKIDSMIKDRIFEDVDLVSDIASIKQRSKCDENFDIGLLSDLSSSDDLEGFPPTLDGKDNELEPEDSLQEIMEDDTEVEMPAEVSGFKIEFARYDELGLNTWGPMREQFVGRKRLKNKPKAVGSPDALSISSGGIDDETEEALQAQIYSAMGIPQEKCNELANEYSAEHGRHDCSLVISRHFHGAVTTLSTNPPEEFRDPDRSHTIHLLGTLGFLNSDQPNSPKYRVTDQIQNGKERLHIRKAKSLGCKKLAKLILKVSFYHSSPGDHLERMDNRYTSSKWSVPVAQLDFIESQPVSDLRRCIHCIKDCVTTVSYASTNAKFLNVEDIAFNTIPQWYMLVEDTIYYDGRYSDSIQAARKFARYSGETLKKKVYFVDASKTHLGDMSIRFGYPYRLFHQDGCMHTVVFNGARLSEELDELKSAFPKYTQENVVPESIKCELDDEALAEWIVTRSARLEEKDHLFVCKKCANELLNCEDSHKPPKDTWRCSFRIEYGSTGIGRGRVMDQPIANQWKSIPYVLPAVESFNTSNNNIIISSAPQPKRRIFVQIPELEPTKLYRFIQPFLLHKAIKPMKRLPPTLVPKAVKPVPLPKKRGRKPKSRPKARGKAQQGKD